MKRFTLLLALFALSCTSHPTAPIPQVPPRYPFPQKCKQVILTYKNVGMDYSYSDTYPTLYGDTTVQGSGREAASNVFSFDFDSAVFTSSGDTIRGVKEFGDYNGTTTISLVAVPDQDNGILNLIGVSYSAEEFGAGHFKQITEYGMTGHGFPYSDDSSSKITASLQGPSLRQAIAALYSNSSYQNGVGNAGTQQNSSYQYDDSVFENSSVTIQFTP